MDNHMDHMQHAHDHSAMHHDHHQMLASMTDQPANAAVNDHNMDGHDMPGHDMSGHSMMSMVFHFGCKEVILFDQWSTETAGGLLGSVLVIMLMAACYEGLKYYREYLFWKTYNSLQYRAVTLPEKTGVVGSSSEDNTRVHMVGEVIHRQPPTITSAIHIYQTFLHIIQVTLSFLLMLIFMTYNVWLCLAVVVGAAIGYFMFGWKKSVIVDVTEHCH